MADDLPPVIAQLIADTEQWHRRWRDAAIAAEVEAERIRRATDRAGSGADASGNRFVAAMGRMGASIGPLVMKVASIGTAIPQVAGLAAAAVQASAALLVLPAAAGAAVLATKTLSIGMSGFGDAVKAAGDPAKFAEAIKGLAPAAQQAAIAVRDLQPAWKGLKLDVQQTLFKGLGEQIRTLGGSYLPILHRNMVGIAGDFNAAGVGIGKYFGRSVIVADMSKAFDNMRQAIHNVVAALQPLSSVFENVFTEGASFLPGLTSGIGAAAEKFSDFVSDLKDSGQLHEIIQQGIDAMKMFGQVAGNIGGILSGVFKATEVSGGGFLNNLVDITGAIRDMINSASGQEALRAFFQTSAALVGDLLRVIQPLLPAVAPLIGLIGQLAMVLGAGLSNVLQVLIPPLGMVIQALVSALQPVIPVLAQAFTQLATALAPIAIQLGGFLAQALQLIAPLLPPLVAAFFALVQALLPIVPPLIEVAQQLLPILVQIIQMAIPVIQALVPVFAQIVTAIAPFITQLANVLIPIIQALLPVVQTVFSVIQSVITDAMQIVKGIIDVVTGIISGDWQKVWNGIKDVVAGVFNGIRDIIGGAMRIIGDIVGSFVDIGKNIVQGIWNGISSLGSWLWDKITGWVKSFVPGPILSFLGIASPSTLMASIAQWVPKGFAKGIDDHAGVVSDSTRRMAQLAQQGALIRTAGAAAGAYRLGGTIASAAALTSAAGPGAGGTTVINNITVAGHVLTEQGLQRVVQTATLNYAGRNTSNGLTVAGV